MTSKADYVRRQGQTRCHHCHWPGCEKQVPPALWGCLPHWRRLPRHLQKWIWATYEPGQEIHGRPSIAYLEAAKAVQTWIRIQELTPNDRQQVLKFQLLLADSNKMDTEDLWKKYGEEYLGPKPVEPT